MVVHKYIFAKMGQRGVNANIKCFMCKLIIDEKCYLHDGVVSLMIVGLTRNRPYVLHSIL